MIGVSESSVKRWADTGRIHVIKTAGGHRRIPLPEVCRFLREEKTPVVALEPLGLAGSETITAGVADRTRITQRLFEVLRTGDFVGAHAILCGLYFAGDEVAAICDGPVCTALRRIGELWRHDPHGIFFEHRATDICLQWINQLRLFFLATQGSTNAVGGAPPGDPYLLPSYMVATVLASEGIAATNLGAETPTESLVQAADHYNARFVWVSMSTEDGLEKFRTQSAALAEALAQERRLLIIGGRFSRQLDLQRYSNCYQIDSLTEMVAFLRGLQAAGKSKSAALTRSPAQRKAMR